LGAVGAIIFPTNSQRVLLGPVVGTSWPPRGSPHASRLAPGLGGVAAAGGGAAAAGAAAFSFDPESMSTTARTTIRPTITAAPTKRGCVHGPCSSWAPDAGAFVLISES